MSEKIPPFTELCSSIIGTALKGSPDITDEYAVPVSARDFVNHIALEADNGGESNGFEGRTYIGSQPQLIGLHANNAVGNFSTLFGPNSLTGLTAVAHATHNNSNACSSPSYQDENSVFPVPQYAHAQALEGFRPQPAEQISFVPTYPSPGENVGQSMYESTCVSLPLEVSLPADSQVLLYHQLQLQYPSPTSFTQTDNRNMGNATLTTSHYSEPLFAHDLLIPQHGQQPTEYYSAHQSCPPTHDPSSSAEPDSTCMLYYSENGEENEQTEMGMDLDYDEDTPELELSNMFKRPGNRRGRRASGNDTAGWKRKTRRRTPTMAQRKAANVRERKRMFNLNSAFDNLRKNIPTFAYEKHLSRIETLKLAMDYINFMKEILHTPPEDLLKYANAAEEMAIKWNARI